MFLPNTGGSGVVARVLATEFSRLGHDVTVITDTLGENRADWRFKVLRRPSLLQSVKTMKDGDVILMNGPMLRYTPIARLFCKSVIMVHHMYPAIGWRGVLDRLLPLSQVHVAPSKAMIGAFPQKWEWHWISNPYDDQTFYRSDQIERRDVVFVGRLVEDKGADECIRGFALAKLPSETRLHIFGDGYSRTSHEALARALGIQERVIFHGDCPPQQVANALREKRVQVVSSRWEEPFGIVALEGLASGCQVIVSAKGGLPEAIGHFGKTYSSGDVDTLAHLITDAYTAEPAWSPELEHHLHSHSGPKVAVRYLQLIQITMGLA